MPRTSLTVTIAQPCTESWEQMTPTARGRHCAACAQEVVDFTHQTDAELLAWLAQPGRAACGRFRPEQLNRPLLPPPPPAPRWRAWLAAVLALWAWREAFPSAAQAQQRPTQHLEPRPVKLQPPVAAAPTPPQTTLPQVAAPMISGVVGGIGLQSVQIRQAEPPKRGQPLLNLEDWLR